MCQLLCFPFALDVDADLLVSILADFRDSEVAVYLLQVLGEVIQVWWWERKMASVVSSDSHPNSSRALQGPHRGGHQLDRSAGVEAALRPKQTCT